jgi:hypothetical protein
MSKQLKGDYAPADIAVFLVMGQLSLNQLFKFMVCVFRENVTLCDISRTARER